MFGGDYDPREDLWWYLKVFHRREWKNKKAEIEERVAILGNKGRDPDKIYAALRETALIQRALRWHTSDKAIARRQDSKHRAVVRALDRLIESLDEWRLLVLAYEPDEPFDVLKPIRSLLRLRERFADVEIKKKFLRNLRAGRPWGHKRVTDLFRRAGVPDEERLALLKALGVFGKKNDEVS